MTQERWNSLSLFEQMSNIGGEVDRLIYSKKNYDSGTVDKNYVNSYFKKIADLIYYTISDPKNAKRGRELLDELYEVERYTMGEVDEQYISSYWNQYTEAISR